MVLANLLNKEGAFVITKNWFYSTELRVLNSQLIYQLGLSLFSDWHIARTFSMTLLLSIFMSSYFFMAKNAQLKNAGVWGAILLLTPLSSMYSWLILIGNFYIFYISQGFLCLGIIFALYHNKHTIKRIIYVSLLMLLSLIAGLSGIRMTIVFFIPLVITLLLLAFVDLLKVKQTDLKNQVISNPIYLLSVIAILAFVFNFVGYYVNSKILQKSYHYLSYNVIVLHDLDLAGLLPVFGQINTLFGYKTGMSPFSLEGLRSLISIMCFIATVFSFIFMIKKLQTLSKSKQILLTFSIILLLSNILINYISDQYHENYLVPAFIYCLIVVSMVLGELKHKNSITKVLSFSFFLIVVLTFYYKPYINYHYSDSCSGKYDVAQWLVENGYEDGFATYWNSNIMTEYSNGQLDMRTILSENYSDELSKLEYREWLQSKHHVRKPPEGRVFILLSQNEYALQPPYAKEENLVYSTNGYFVYEYCNYNDLYATLEN